MALTMVQSETILVARRGGFMTKAGLAVTKVGTNADLADPISWALMQMDYAVTDILVPAAADLAALATDEINQFLDLSEYRLLQNIEGNLPVADITIGPRSIRESQFATEVQSALERKKKQIEDLYGFGSSADISGGVLVQDFATHGDDADDI